MWALGFNSVGRVVVVHCVAVLPRQPESVMIITRSGLGGGRARAIWKAGF